VRSHPRRLRRRGGHATAPLHGPRSSGRDVQRGRGGSVRPGLCRAALPDGLRKLHGPRGVQRAPRPFAPLNPAFCLFHTACRTRKRRGFGARRNPQRNAAVLCGFRRGTIPRLFRGETLDGHVSRLDGKPLLGVPQNVPPLRPELGDGRPPGKSAYTVFTSYLTARGTSIPRTGTFFRYKRNGPCRPPSKRRTSTGRGAWRTPFSRIKSPCARR
jgi:hypothetical protein